MLSQRVSSAVSSTAGVQTYGRSASSSATLVVISSASATSIQQHQLVSKNSQHQQLRHRTSGGWQGGGKNRFKNIRERALNQHIDYIRQMGPKIQYRDPKKAHIEGDQLLKDIKSRTAARFGSNNSPTYREGGYDVEHRFRKLRESIDSSMDLTEAASDSVSNKSSRSDESSSNSSHQSDDIFEKALNPQYNGFFHGFELPGFGTIEIIHGNIFDYDKRGNSTVPKKSDSDALSSDSLSDDSLSANSFDNLWTDPSYQQFFMGLKPATQERILEVCLDKEGRVLEKTDGIQKLPPSCFPTVALIPMISSFLPFRGYSLETLERGGETLVKDCFAATRALLAKQNQELELDTPGSDPAVQLDVGSVVMTHTGQPRNTLVTMADSLAFLIMPYFFQGSSLDAAHRLRYCIRQGLRESGGASTLIMNHLAMGIYGYEPRKASKVLLEECIEAMLQVDSERSRIDFPRRIRIIEKDLSSCKSLARSLEELREVWIPSERTMDATEYYSKQFQRLICLPETPRQFLRQHRVIFPQRRSVIRNRRQHWIHNIQPFIWRRQKMLQPPEHRVKAESGIPSERQPRPRIFGRLGYKGYQMSLNPITEHGFIGLRRNIRGQLIAKPKREIRINA